MTFESHANFNPLSQNTQISLPKSKVYVPLLDLKTNEFGELLGNKERRKTPQELILLTPSVEEDDDFGVNQGNLQYEYTQDDDEEESYYSEI